MAHRLNEVAARRTIGVQDGEGFLFVGFPTEVHRAETQLGNLETSAAQGAFFDHG